jgi:hypothetical protein
MQIRREAMKCCESKSINTPPKTKPSKRSRFRSPSMIELSTAPAPADFVNDIKDQIENFKISAKSA